MAQNAEPVCAICGDEVVYDLAGEPTHASTTDEHHAPVPAWIDGAGQ